MTRRGILIEPPRLGVGEMTGRGFFPTRVMDIRMADKAVLPPDFDPSLYVSLYPDLMAARVDGTGALSQLRVF